MTWSYRVVRRVFFEGGQGEEVTYAVHEAYYDDDGNVTSITKNSVAPIYSEAEDDDPDNKWSLKKDFEQQMEAFNHPILNYEDY